MEEVIPVKLIGPAKIDGVREPIGKTVLVTHKVARQLADSGAITPISDLDDLPVAIAAAETEADDFEEAVAEKAQQIANSIVEKAITAEIDKLADTLGVERDEAIKRAETAEAKVADLERQLATNTKVETAKAPAAKKPKPKSPAKAGGKS